MTVDCVRVDQNTRCKHYSTAHDIIAIKFKCCNTYYPCYQCHEELADHQPVLWDKNEWSHTKAILCGVCATELTIQEYMDCDSICPNCQSPFNVGCQKHYHLYFNV
ncbi:CHY zinc finger protein [Pseudomonas sp. 2822-17]|uniref:CHY zinc finger protein n=1 Tax=Pseudomonas sp. 2822-17 TaxID=1712678 RepID=UPI000C158D92